MSWSGTIHCGYCWDKGHNRVTCPKRKANVEERRKEDPTSWVVESYDQEQENRKVRTCKYCSIKGHNKRTCEELKKDIANTQSNCSEWRRNALKAMDELGLGIGSLVIYKGSTALVVDIHWGEGSHWAALDPEAPRRGRGNWNTRPRTPAMFTIQPSNLNLKRMVYIPFPKHPIVAPHSRAEVLAPAPKSFTEDAPPEWTTQEPSHRVMAQFDSDNW